MRLKPVTFVAMELRNIRYVLTASGQVQDTNVETEALPETDHLRAVSLTLTPLLMVSSFNCTHPPEQFSSIELS